MMPLLSKPSSIRPSMSPFGFATPTGWRSKATLARSIFESKRRSAHCRRMPLKFSRATKRWPQLRKVLDPRWLILMDRRVATAPGVGPEGRLAIEVIREIFIAAKEINTCDCQAFFHRKSGKSRGSSRYDLPSDLLLIIALSSAERAVALRPGPHSGFGHQHAIEAAPAGERCCSLGLAAAAELGHSATEGSSARSGRCNHER